MSNPSQPPIDSPPSASGPLAGIKVVELGQLIAGPFAAKTLADFGANVIKIEPPGAGDPLRKWRLLKDGTSVWWQVQSRNKRSLALNLRDPQAQDIVRQLATDADVLIENFRPGAMEGWGLGPEVLQQLNPRLIVLRISGYGQTGPWRDKPGFGVVAEAMGGLRHLTAEPGRVPVRVGVSIGDTLASLHGVIGILMALHFKRPIWLGIDLQPRVFAGLPQAIALQPHAAFLHQTHAHPAGAKSLAVQQVLQLHQATTPRSRRV